MAEYICDVGIIGRGSSGEDGSSGNCSVGNALAAAAYRSCSKIMVKSIDRQTGVVTERKADYTNKSHCVYSEIFLPELAPEWMSDRQLLWEHVETIEKRVDAQLARDVMIGIPIEMNREQGIEVIREFVYEAFVKKGMVADANIHWEDGNPHAHIMLSLRHVEEEGFGKKNRDWNLKYQLLDMRKKWADIANHHLERAGYEERIDHRSLKDRGLDLEPLISEPREVIELEKQGIETDLRSLNKDIILDRIEKIDREPDVVLKKLSQQRATFTKAHIAIELDKLIRGDVDSYHRLLSKVMASEKLVTLDQKDLKGEVRYSYSDYYEKEKSLYENVLELKDRHVEAINEKHLAAVLKQYDIDNPTIELSEEQRLAVRSILAGGDLVNLVGRAGTGKTTVLKVVADYYAMEGRKVVGASISGIASYNLGLSAAIESRTIASWRYEWEKGDADTDTLRGGVFIVDEAGMVDTSSMAALMHHAKEHNIKLIPVGDPEQFQPISSGQAFRGLVEECGGAVLETIYRQTEEWQKEAVSLFAQGEAKKGLKAFVADDRCQWSTGKDTARQAILRDVFNYMEQSETKDYFVMAYRREDAKYINREIRTRLKQLGQLEKGISYKNAEGYIELSVGDRILFTTIDRKKLKVMNGTLGTVISQTPNSLTVEIAEGDDKKRVVSFKPEEYRNFVYGYAATLHKSQGVTVDQSFVLADKNFDAHASYVAFSRHRKDVTLYANNEDFSDVNMLYNILGRSTERDLAIEYSADLPTEHQQRRSLMVSYKAEKDAVRALADEIHNWADKKNKSKQDHHRWDEFLESVEARSSTAKKICRDLLDYRRLLREAGIYEDTVKYHAGELAREKTPFELEEEERLKAFIDKHKRADMLWNRIKQDVAISKVMTHPDYPAFNEVRYERNRLADSLVQHRVRQHDIYTDLLDEHGLKWSHIRYAAKDFIKRQVPNRALESNDIKYLSLLERFEEEGNKWSNSEYEAFDKQRIDLLTQWEGLRKQASVFDAQDHLAALAKTEFGTDYLSNESDRAFLESFYDKVTTIRGDLQQHEAWLKSFETKLKHEEEVLVDLQWHVDKYKQQFEVLFKDPNRAFVTLDYVTHHSDQEQAAQDLLVYPERFGELQEGYLDIGQEKKDKLKEQVLLYLEAKRKESLQRQSIEQLGRTKKYHLVQEEIRSAKLVLGRFVYEHDYKKLGKIVSQVERVGKEYDYSTSLLGAEGFRKEVQAQKELSKQIDIMELPIKEVIEKAEELAKEDVYRLEHEDALGVKDIIVSLTKESSYEDKFKKLSPMINALESSIEQEKKHENVMRSISSNEDTLVKISDRISENEKSLVEDNKALEEHLKASLDNPQPLLIMLRAEEYDTVRKMLSAKEVQELLKGSSFLRQKSKARVEAEQSLRKAMNKLYDVEKGRGLLVARRENYQDVEKRMQKTKTGYQEPTLEERRKTRERVITYTALLREHFKDIPHKELEKQQMNKLYDLDIVGQRKGYGLGIEM